MIKRSFSVFVKRVMLVAIIVLVGSCGMFTSSETASPADEEPIVLTGSEIIVTMGEDGELLYAPEDISVSVGDTVVWDNKSGAHNVVFGKVPDGVDAEAISESTLAREPGPAHSVTFEVPGLYKYHCTPHKELGMFGTVTVE
ncbi:MAG: plastocyanin/azurin family copper-binding protein [Cyanobacteria bacterium P01_F01_bin.116]